MSGNQYGVYLLISKLYNFKAFKANKLYFSIIATATI